MAAVAANKAGRLILKGGLTLFKESIIFFEEYPQPILKPARP